MNKKFQWGVALLLVLVSAGILVPSNAKRQKKAVDGQQVFQQHCASCHQNGDNKVNPNHPLAGSKELATLASFKNYLAAPPGHMPYYEHIVNDDATLRALYKYCKQLKRPPIKQACL